MKRVLKVSAVAASLLVTSTVLAKDRHPNLTTASADIEAARNHITAAQEANEWDMQGHAKNAKALLDQAAEELAKAREAANDKK
jgi:hypothetical protein